ncbi:MAG TPA: YicC/YloC family endoribonuclease [Burkholderiaceae bacterium]|nr:YicC/YloC family endoribonuclease [Burkholderiaceae bacterium]
MKPVASMTGFASAARPTALGRLTLELRSVNSRFLDLTLKMPDDLRNSEGAVREAIAAQVARGKVECRISIARGAGENEPQLNATALQQLAALASQVERSLPAVAPISTADVLNWPGVVETPGAEPDVLRMHVLAALTEALAALAQSRGREGAALTAVMLDQCEQIERVAAQLSLRTPDLIAAVERKLNERLEKQLGPALSGASALTREEVSERIRQEVTLYALKMDVDEEIKRLLTHVAEVRRVLAAGGAVGRRLDFLMQELNREANTLGSKASAIEMTNAAVELKILIEQMREQVQNLE